MPYATTGIRGVSNKIRKFKRMAQSLEDAKDEFRIEVDRVVDDLETTKKEIQSLLDTIQKGE